jgi:predicted transcriptional regulator
MEAFGVEFGSAKESQQLSALQQGIQGITEDTAGALEAITSGMSQQVYYQSTLLEQIRDAIMGTNSDIQLGVQGQMLLQLQQSFQVQMAIQGILEGVLTPSGQGFRVELLS